MTIIIALKAVVKQGFGPLKYFGRIDPQGPEKVVLPHRIARDSPTNPNTATPSIFDRDNFLKIAPLHARAFEDIIRISWP